MQEKLGPFAPWWRHGIVWMVWGGPAMVVAACVITAVLIVLHPDPALRAAALNMQQVPADDDSSARQPALPARNHAAEGH